ncbi:hypothetical protein HY945_05415 [Candidatus Gottesmanbacteria bacterium]|nr:hypothetical protein [Candidatus Gottesmanbacteria bacterium]
MGKMTYQEEIDDLSARPYIPSVIREEVMKRMIERASKEAKTINIGIKKRHLVGLFGLLSISIGLFLAQEIFKWVSSQNVIELIILAVFVVSVIYVLLYFKEYHSKTKIAEEAAKEVADGDMGKEEQIREHLFSKIWNESYSFRKKL